MNHISEYYKLTQKEYRKCYDGEVNCARNWNFHIVTSIMQKTEVVLKDKTHWNLLDIEILINYSIQSRKLSFN